MNKKIACVVVTFNRKDLLIKCLDAIKSQKYKPYMAYIIDNASTDGTKELVSEKGYYNKNVEGICFEYLCLPENIGGSGGFYTGIKMAYESDEHFDGVWVMDDDGVPEENQLYELLPYLEKYGYVSPLVLNIENPSEYAMFVPQSNHPTDENGNYLDVANPFNGILYSRELVCRVGFPEKNMFIWGDENNYHNRCIKAGFHPLIVIKAIHFHPKDRQQKEESWFGRKIALPKEDWKLYCYARNRVYNSYVINGYLKSLGRSFLDFFDFFVVMRRKGQLSRIKVVIEAQKDGRRGVIVVNRKYV